MQKNKKNYEIIYVDDGSTDKTIEIICSIQTVDPSVRIIKLSRNYGHQIALSAGLDHSEGEFTITMDADLQHPPELIPEFLKKQVRDITLLRVLKIIPSIEARLKIF